MSALGQKQTFRGLRRMSALPLDAGTVVVTRDVRFVPIADVRPDRGTPHQAFLLHGWSKQFTARQSHTSDANIPEPAGGDVLAFVPACPSELLNMAHCSLGY